MNREVQHTLTEDERIRRYAEAMDVPESIVNEVLAEMRERREMGI